ncbi:MAG: glycolate oxidase subunit GlcF [Anaerolineae bacterium]|nr:glycolate oxidase subunit GlcF [Thermoflexales bacterium]MDW8054607.1 glycolate oxidase subunit GlcF [Anaerolineae bacterium]
MEHRIQPNKFGAHGAVMAEAVATCVHCGFCLASCPTYKLLGEEMDSPRGRIVLMKDVLEGTLSLNEAAPYIDQCLGCLACVTACPSGVRYGELLTAYRAYSEPQRRRTFVENAKRMLMRETLPHPSRFRAAARLGQLAKPLKAWLPRPLVAMLDLLPDQLPPSTPPLPEVIPAQGQRRARVALLAGCVQQVLWPRVNRATVELLTKQGVEVVIPRGQGCCGALSMHIGEAEHARQLARRNLDAFPSDVDAILSNAAGCGSAMKEYGLLFRGTSDEARAEAFARKVRDVSEFLDALGLREVRPLLQPLTAAYHDACHLAHAQGIWGAPRRLLAAIPNLTLREIAEAELCCGSAGTYNIEHPDLASQLGQRKARNILDTGAEVVITGNIGCAVQIQAHLAKLGKPLPVLHTVEVLAKAAA